MNVIEYLESSNTQSQIAALIKENLHFYQAINTESKIESFTGMLYNMFVKECVQINQYISLSNDSINKVNAQYRKLVHDLKSLSDSNFDSHITDVIISHRRALVGILKRNAYSESVDQVLFPCSEYSGEFQYRLLRMDALELSEPIIDVGCGQNCALVDMLKSKGYEKVYGIDQFESDRDGIYTSNWLNYDFKPNSFGTVISHMAFSNHFNRAIVFDDDKIDLYKSKYRDILESLVPNGLFIYSPSVTRVEEDLDKNKYRITRYSNDPSRDLDTVQIQKIK